MFTHDGILSEMRSAKFGNRIGSPSPGAGATLQVWADSIGVGAFARLLGDTKRHLATERMCCARPREVRLLPGRTACGSSLVIFVTHKNLIYKKNLNYETHGENGAVTLLFKLFRVLKHRFTRRL